VFCDSGVEPKQIAILLKRRQQPDSAVRSFESLYRYIWDLINGDKIRYFMADENSSAIIFRGQSSQLRPVGPKPEVIAMSIRGSIAAGRIRQDFNKISVILILEIRAESGSFDGLLTADTDAAGFASAVDRLRRTNGNEPRFDFVKVSHHGSLDSHRGSNICDHRKRADAIAAISAGSFDVLPDREVIRDFLKHEWIVLLTTKRIPVKNYAVSLSGKPKIVVQERTITIQWYDGRLSWMPPDSRVHDNELSLYQSADDSKSAGRNF
jgi:hypothetical protein